jgi:hypothetical protein
VAFSGACVCRQCVAIGDTAATEFLFFFSIFEANFYVDGDRIFGFLKLIFVSTATEFLFFL